MRRNHLTARLLLAMGLGATLSAACGGNEDGTASSATAGSGGSTSGAGGSPGGAGGTTAAGSGGSTSGSGGSAGSLGGTGGAGTGGAGAGGAGAGGAGTGGAGAGGAGAGGSCTTSCSESVLCYAPDGSRATTDPKGGPTSCAAAVHDVGGTCPSIPLQQTECFPLGTCWQPSTVAVTTPVGDACCYKMKVCVSSCCGRPIFVDGSVRIAVLVRGDRWAGTPAWV